MNLVKFTKNGKKNKLIPGDRTRQRSGEMSLAELLTIIIYFQLSPCKDLKNYYLYYLPIKYKAHFSNLIRYSRMIQLMPRLLPPISVLLHLIRGEQTGIYYVDSTKLQICHNKRTNSHRVKGLANMGKSSYGWFMGFKLHLIINHKGEFMAIKITKANTADSMLLNELSKNLIGKIYGDKGYISSQLFKQLFARGLWLFTGIRKTMKNQLIELQNKILLRKRSLIESVFNILKNRINLEHTRHRSPINFLVNILSSVAAFALKSLPKSLITTNSLIQN